MRHQGAVPARVEGSHIRTGCEHREGFDSSPEVLDLDVLESRRVHRALPAIGTSAHGRSLCGVRQREEPREVREAFGAVRQEAAEK